MEEATTKVSEDEIKFDEVHAYLSKGEYPAMRYEEAKTCHKTDSERLPTGWWSGPLRCEAGIS